MATQLNPGQVYRPKMKNVAQKKCLNLFFFKMHQFQEKNPRKFENDKKWRISGQQLKAKIVKRKCARSVLKV